MSDSPGGGFQQMGGSRGGERGRGSGQVGQRQGEPGRGSDARGGGGGRGGHQQRGYHGQQGDNRAAAGGGARVSVGYAGGRNGGGNHHQPGGFHRPRGPPPDWTTEPLPNYSVQDLKKIDEEIGGTGWAPFPYDKKESVVLKVYEGPPAKEYESLIRLSVNHYLLKNFHCFPKNIFHYEVTMERLKQGQSKPSEPKSSPSKAQPRDKKRRRKDGSPEDPSQSAGGRPTQRRLPKPLPQLVLQFLLQKIRVESGHFGIVSDLSNNVYSTCRLRDFNIPLVHWVNMTDVDQTILQENDNGVIKVTLTLTVQQIDTNAMQAHLKQHGSWKGFAMDPSVKTTLEQVLNAVVKTLPSYRFLPMGRSNIARWPKENEPGYLGSNVVCWKGISANISMGWKPYLCADLAHCAFLDDASVFDALGKRWNSAPNNLRQWERWQMTDAKSFLKNVKVKYTVNGRTLAGNITDVLRESVADAEFFWEQQQMPISVLKYFKLQYGIDLLPDGPCLELKKRNKVPAELCIIKKGQSFSRKLDDAQTDSMLKMAKKDPHVLKNEIHTQISDLSTDRNKVAKAWGVELDNKMLRLKDTRVLAPPLLRYGTGTQENSEKGSAIISPINGEWGVWNSNFKFLEPRAVGQWGILTVGCRVNKEQINNLADKLMENGAKKGIVFSQRPILEDDASSMNENSDPKQNVNKLKNIFKNKFQNNGCRMVVVIIPKKYSPLYSHVKQAAELFDHGVGLLTQCIVGKNVYQGIKDATVQNILLKLNSKLGGVNHAILTPPDTEILKEIDILRCPMLIIGADVTHPPPGSMKKVGNKEFKIPSFAAVTGSIDKTGMPFMMDIKAQQKADRGAAEVIQNLDEIVHKMLVMFLKNTGGVPPRKIIYYRDGIGEGQFPEVLHTEMLAIRKACGEFKDYDGEKYEPKITFVTVQKRHKTRFFYHPTKGGVENPPPGSVVDREIVHQTETDFYLCSHKGMMGTSRPTRYHVLWDDSNFTADQIQTLTYYLCYMYVRCNKSVRIPAPTYYAHWACVRAKALTDGLEEYFGDDLTVLNQKMRRHQILLNNFPMHFV